MIHTRVSYAQQAFAALLEQHEIFIHQDNVRAIPMADGTLALYSETDDCSADGSFAGGADGGAITLGLVMKGDGWEHRFDTVDQFKGTKPDGTPILLTR